MWSSFSRASATATRAPLSMLTGGLHLHTLCCPNEDAYTRACAALKAAGLLLGD